MKLNNIQKESALWVAIEAELKGELELLRAQNDNDKDPLETAKLRGRIAEVKQILNWASVEPKFE